MFDNQNHLYMPTLLYTSAEMNFCRKFEPEVFFAVMIFLMQQLCPKASHHVSIISTK